MDDDQRERDERGQRARGDPEQGEPHGLLAEDRRGHQHGHELSLNGFVASLNSDTRWYFPFSTRTIIASREKTRKPASELISGKAGLLKSNGATSGRLI